RSYRDVTGSSVLFMYWCHPVNRFDSRRKRVRLIGVRRFPLVIAFVAVLIGLALPASALAACMSDLSNRAQLPCCKAARPDCEHHSAPSMKCCKIGEHPEQQVTAKIPVVAKPARTLMAADRHVGATTPALRFPTRQYVHPSRLFAGTTSPPHLAFSALLI